MESKLDFSFNKKITIWNILVNILITFVEKLENKVIK